MTPVETNISVIGCGGIGSRIANEVPGLLYKGSTLTFIDNDKVEKKNLDRQIFQSEDLDRYKSVVIAKSLSHHPRVTSKDVKIQAHTCFLDAAIQSEKIKNPCVMFVCVDNHPARIEALDFIDQDTEGTSMAVLAANETESAEAYVYFADWKGTPLDPRVYYPELLTDTSGDPRQPPCTGAAQLDETPQLGIANQRAAALASWLYYLWAVYGSEYESPQDEGYRNLIYRVTSSAASFITYRIREAV